MVKSKYIFFVYFFLFTDILSAFPFIFSPNTKFKIYPEKSEIIKYIQNTSYEIDALNKIKYQNYYFNNRLFGLSYDYSKDKIKLKDNYVKAIYSLELISKQQIAFNGKLIKISFISGDYKTDVLFDEVFSEIYTNVYNAEFNSWSTPSKIVEFRLDKSDFLTMIVFFEENGIEYSISQNFSISKKKHLIELMD